MTHPENYFVAESLRHARTLPHAECIDYLRGLIMLIDGNIVTNGGLDLHTAVRKQLDSDAQLELIAASPMEFHLELPR